MLNKQNVLDSAVKYYREGGMPGFENSQCVYIDDSNGRCAVGVLLHDLKVPDEDIRTSAESALPEMFAEEGNVCADAIRRHCAVDVWRQDTPDGSVTTSFLMRLQNAHDRVADDYYFSEWPEDIGEQLLTSFEKFAESEGLTIN
jgi:hypothetical protein